MFFFFLHFEQMASLLTQIPYGAPNAILGHHSARTEKVVELLSRICEVLGPSVALGRGKRKQEL